VRFVSPAVWVGPRDHLRDHFRQRECYGEVWRRESTREGFDENKLPECLWSQDEPKKSNDASASLDIAVDALEEPDVVGLTSEAWDAGEMACGDLVLALRARMNSLAPGTRLKLTAHDPGATEDIPAWCRMTGHKLLTQHHPHYWIQRKD
jgi:tRNA 2-thiouridine synthesizing protein A